MKVNISGRVASGPAAEALLRKGLEEMEDMIIPVMVIILLGVVCVAAAAKLGGQVLQETTTTELPKPYNFGFEVRDDETTNYQNRAEVSDSSGRVRGSYSYVLPDGFVYTITYEDNKDGNGLKAVVKKEPSGIEVIIPTHKPKKAIDHLA
ncbi:larval cuticle protein A2B-like isoform X1 [Panulirus ornatus]|uniref:larval cuticle protein A2B-like isoform X1 n=1 Tax=Panulirus ornatus TaxID=150431 RepID=UPI003A89A5B3